jgi:hypothetical protein
VRTVQGQRPGTGQRGSTHTTTQEEDTVSKRSTAAAWMRARAEQAPLAAVWAAGAALTAVGMYSVAMACGIPGELAWLYPLIFDGLALVAYRATTRTTKGAQRYAAFVVVLCTGLSALAQAAHLAASKGLTADDTNNLTNLKAGVGAAPAIAVALAAHLHWLTTKPAAVGRPVTDTAPGQQEPDTTLALAPAVPQSGTSVTAHTNVPQTPGGSASGATLPAPDAGPEDAPILPPARPVTPDPLTPDPVTPDPVHGDPLTPTVTPDPDPSDPDPLTPAGGPGQGVTGPQGHRATGQVDLSKLTGDQLVAHYLRRGDPVLTVAQLASRLGVSKTTAKRRVRAARADDADDTVSLRVVR